MPPTSRRQRGALSRSRPPTSALSDDLARAAIHPATRRLLRTAPVAAVPRHSRDAAQTRLAHTLRRQRPRSPASYPDPPPTGAPAHLGAAPAVGWATHARPAG